MQNIGYRIGIGMFNFHSQINVIPIFHIMQYTVP